MGRAPAVYRRYGTAGFMKRFRLSHTLKAALLLVAVQALAVLSARAAPPPDDSVPVPTTKSIDLTTVFDANNLLMFVTNTGSFAFDATGFFGTGAGLHYPRGTNNRVVYAGGLWIGAKLGKGVRVSAAEYAFDYAPGPMAGGTFLPDRESFRVYKINSGDTPESNPDYHDWPFADGAPAVQNAYGVDSLDNDGHRIPLIRGDQTLWTVFNDADPDLRLSDPGSRWDRPLGLEVQLLAWGYARAGALGGIVFLDYTIINKGDSTLRETYVALWSDPDIGVSDDDLIGCDTALSLGYCYNDGPDGVYGDAPPAVGYLLLRGPAVPAGSSHDATGAENQILPMTVFAGYGSGFDPGFAREAYDYLRGRTVDGHRIIDPITGDTTTFVLSGDPVTGTGWLDTDPGDKRFLISAGPFTMPPGDTQHVTAAVIVGRGSDALSSITVLKQAAAVARALLEYVPVPLAVDLLPGKCPDILSTQDWPYLRSPRSATAGESPHMAIAVMGTAAFDVTALEATSFTLEGVLSVGHDYVDVGAPPLAAEFPCDCSVSGRDGRTDLVLQFDQADLLAALEPFTHGDQRMLTIAGNLKSGTAVSASACVILHNVLEPIVIGPSFGGGRDPKTQRELLLGNHPNPFNAGTVIRYFVETDGPVRVEVFDVTGRRVATLVDGIKPAGYHQAEWNGRNAAGHVVASGLYIARLTTADAVASKKLLLLK